MFNRAGAWQFCLNSQDKSTVEKKPSFGLHLPLALLNSLMYMLKWVSSCSHMRTHARYELQESTSIEEGGSAGTESPVPGSGPVTSRSVSSESADLPPLPIWQQENKTGNKPPSPMDTQEAAGQNKKE